MIYKFERKREEREFLEIFGGLLVLFFFFFFFFIFDPSKKCRTFFFLQARIDLWLFSFFFWRFSVFLHPNGGLTGGCKGMGISGS